MGLQVRVRHALGERLVELPERAVDNPLVVGRSATADVQVPSVTVAQKHCALFVHDGVWVVQDLAPASGTFLNGQPVTEPTALNLGDVVAVGVEATAPTIEIDPAAAGEGRTGPALASPVAAPAPGDAAHAYASVPQGHTYEAQGYAAAGHAFAPAPGGHYGAQPAGAYGGAAHLSAGYAPPASSAGPAVGAPGYAAPAAYATPAQAPAHADAAAHSGWGEADAEGHEHVAGWDHHGEHAAAPTYAPVRRRPAGNGGGAAIVVGVLLAAVIIGGTIWYAVKKRTTSQVQGRQSPAAASPSKAIEDDDPAVSSKVFGNPGGGKTVGGSGQRPAPKPPQPPVATPAAPPATAPSAERTAPPIPATPVEPPKDPGGASPGPAVAAPAPPPPDQGTKPDVSTSAEGSWDQMVELSVAAPDAAIAILKFEDYKRTHPGEQDAKLDEFIDKKLDQIWWDRINQLFKARDRLTVDRAKKQRELFDETNPEFKQKFVKEIQELDKEVKRTNQFLREDMGYAEDQPPDITSKAKLAEAQGKRDAKKYETWKKRTHGFIKRNNGKLEWGGQ